MTLVMETIKILHAVLAVSATKRSPLALNVARFHSSKVSHIMDAESLKGQALFVF